MTAPKSVAPDSLPLDRPLSADLERLRRGLRIITLRALGDPDTADEAVQETLARAVVAIDTGRFNDPAKLGAYVAGIARHVCSHIVRDRKATVSIEGDDAGGALATEPLLRVWPDPLEALISSAEMERLRVAFRALSPTDQDLLRRSFDGEQSPGELAHQMAEPAERVRKRKSRALERLRRAFLGTDDGHEVPTSGTKTVTPMTTRDE